MTSNWRDRLAQLWDDLEGGILRASALLTVMYILARGLGFLFNLALGRILGPGAFGTLAALLAALGVLERGVAAVQTNVAREVSVARAEAGDAEAVTADVARLALALGALFAVGIGLASPLVSRYLQVPLEALGLVALSVLLTPPALLGLGVIQGREWFDRLGGLSATGSALRLLAGTGLALAGLGVLGGFTGHLARHALFALVVALWFAPDLGVLMDRRIRWDLLWGSLPTVLAYAGLSGMMGLDILVAKTFFPGPAAGWYAGASAIGRAALVLPAGIGLVITPRVARARHGGSNLRDELERGFLLTALASLAVLVPLVLFPGFISVTGLGAAFAETAQFLPLVTGGMAALAMLNFEIRYFVALDLDRPLVVLGSGVLLEVALLAVFHETLIQVATVFLVSTVAVAGVGAGIAWFTIDHS